MHIICSSGAWLLVSGGCPVVAMGDIFPAPVGSSIKLPKSDATSFVPLLHVRRGASAIFPASVGSSINPLKSEAETYGI